MRAVLLLGLVGCGEVVEPPRPDPTPPPTSNGTFASATTINPSIGATTVAIPATNEGDQMFVLLGGRDPGGIDDLVAGGEHVGLGLGGLMSGCDRWAWTFQSLALPAGITDVTFTTRSQVAVSGYVLVFSGLSEPGFSRDFSFRGGDTFPATAPDHLAGSGNVIISVIGTCGTIDSLADAPFTSLPSIEGLAIAYVIPDQPVDSYGASWPVGDGEWMSATQVFR